MGDFSVLLVDDKKEVVNVIGNMISEELQNIKVYKKYNGRSAIEKIKNTHIDLVVTDIKMPFLTGLELIEECKKINSHIKFIILTGYDEFDYAQQAIRLGAIDYLLKPFSFEHLKELIIKLKETNEESHRTDEFLSTSKNHINKNIEIIKNSVMVDYLKEKNSISSEELFNQCGMESIHQKEVSTILFNMKIETSEPVDKAEQSLIEFALKNIGTELLKNIGEVSAFVIEGGEVLFIFYSDDFMILKEEIYRNVLENIQSKLKSYFSVSVTIGISEIYNNQEALLFYFKQTLVALKNRFFFGIGSIIDYNLTLEGDSSKQLCDTELFKQRKADFKELIQAINSNDVNRYEHYCKSIFESDAKKYIGFEQSQVVQMISKNVIYLFNGMEFEFTQNLGDTLEKVTSHDNYLDMEQCLQEVVNELWQAKLEIKDSNQGSIEFIKKYIDNHFNEALTLKALSEKIYISPTYLSVLFKEMTGENFVDYLVSVRIKEAKKLLRTTDMKIYEICEAVGYRDQKHFTSLFKKITRVTPKQWKKLNTINLKTCNFL